MIGISILFPFCFSFFLCTFAAFIAKNRFYMKKVYRPRIADLLLAEKLEGKGAVLIEGAKWCGKTTTAEQIARSVCYMSEPGMVERNIQLSALNPRLLLGGAAPRLIDEWQIAPQLWDAIRFEVDHRGGTGHFVLTGSAVPADTSKVLHSGTGRFAWLRMRPMTLWESGESTGEVSLSALFDSDEVGGACDLDLERVAFITCRGGWPSSLTMRPRAALEQAFDYLAAVEHRDISMSDGIVRDHARVHRFLRSYARHQGTQASYGTMRADMAASDESLTEVTIGSYVNALRRIFVIEDVEAWNPNLRSRTAIRTSDTRYFTDPSIAAAALGIGPNDLMSDLSTFGLLFETLAVRDLRVYAEALHGTLYHYRDKNGLECDAVVHLRDGRYGLVEVKLGGDALIAEGVKTLTTLAAKIDTTMMREPSFLAVLTATGSYAYRRADGITIIPIGTLRP